MYPFGFRQVDRTFIFHLFEMGKPISRRIPFWNNHLGVERIATRPSQGVYQRNVWVRPVALGLRVSSEEGFDPMNGPAGRFSPESACARFPGGHGTRSPPPPPDPTGEIGRFVLEKKRDFGRENRDDHRTRIGDRRGDCRSIFPGGGQSDADGPR